MSVLAAVTLKPSKPGQDPSVSQSVVIQSWSGTYCEAMSGILGRASLTPVMMTRSATITLLEPDLWHWRVTFHRELGSPTVTGLTDTTSVSNWQN